MLQILAASTLPAVSKFYGVHMPDTINNDVLAYIGAAVIAYIFIRLMWAPYAIWKDDRASVAELKLELSKPERLVLAHTARHKAKAISKVQSLLVEVHNATFLDDEVRLAKSYEWVHKIEKQITRSGLDYRFSKVVTSFASSCCKLDRDLEDTSGHFDDFGFLSSALKFTEGKTTIEDLMRQLPQDIEPEKQQ